MNLATILLGLFIFIIFLLVIRKIILDKKSHKCSCGSSTSGCSQVCGLKYKKKNN